LPPVRIVAELTIALRVALASDAAFRAAQVWAAEHRSDACFGRGRADKLLGSLVVCAIDDAGAPCHGFAGMNEKRHLGAVLSGCWLALVVVACGGGSKSDGGSGGNGVARGGEGERVERAEAPRRALVAMQ
jgi:hypothetical protein